MYRTERRLHPGRALLGPARRLDAADDARRPASAPRRSPPAMRPRPRRARPRRRPGRARDRRPRRARLRRPRRGPRRRAARVLGVRGDAAGGGGRESPPELMITHAPGHMFVTDVRRRGRWRRCSSNERQSSRAVKGDLAPRRVDPVPGRALQNRRQDLAQKTVPSNTSPAASSAAYPGGQRALTHQPPVERAPLILAVVVRAGAARQEAEAVAQPGEPVEVERVGGRSRPRTSSSSPRSTRTARPPPPRPRAARRRARAPATRRAAKAVLPPPT